MTFRLRNALAAAAGAIFLVAAGGASARDAAPSTPDLPGRLVEAASAYETYMTKASMLTPNFRNGEDVAKALTVGASYEAAQLQEGAVAYVAMLALQDARFVRGARSAAQSDPYFSARLLSDPRSVADLPGADAAAAEAAYALKDHGGRLLTAGKAMKQAAYDVQHQAWSKGNVANPAARLAKVKAISTKRYAPTPEDSARLQVAVVRTNAHGGGDRAYAPVVARGLALAAMAAAGEARDLERVKPLLSEQNCAFCMRMAKLNLYQCLSVARPHYEDVFCLGVHAMTDTAQCVLKGADAPADAPRRIASTAAVASAAPAPASRTDAVAAGQRSRRR